MTKALLIFLAMNLINFAPAQAQDLPEKGASFFDAMQNTVGINYDGKPLPLTPHPFEALLTRLNQQSSFFTSVIPFGRSLQKMAAYPDSLKSPRVLVATTEVSKNLNTHFRGRLFIAYVEAAKKLEVISYNPLLGRYEFQIVDNFYPGGKAQARYMPRSLCLRCHQGDTPIFAGGEWQETTAFNAELLKLSEAAIGKKTYFGISLSRDPALSSYDAQPLPEQFEDMVRFGALLIGYQKAWQDLCSSGRPVECKRKLIKWMLVTNLYDKLSLEPDLDVLRRFVAVLGDGTVPLASEKLPDHNPLVNGQLSYQMPPEIDPSLPREPLRIAMASKGDPLGLQFYKFYTFMKSMGDGFFTAKDLEHFRTLLGRKAEVCLPDPTFLMQSLNAKEKATRPAQNNCFPRDTWTRFNKAIDTLPLMPKDSLSREIILQELDKKLGTQYAADICCQTTLTASARQEMDKKKRLDPLTVKDQRLHAFFKFCSECHLYQDLPPPFLAGDSETQVLQNIRNRAELIQFRLQSKQMPPHFAHLQPSENEREGLLQNLKSIKDK